MHFLVYYLKIIVLYYKYKFMLPSSFLNICGYNDSYFFKRGLQLSKQLWCLIFKILIYVNVYKFICLSLNFICSKFIFRNLKDANLSCFRSVSQPESAYFPAGILNLNFLQFVCQLEHMIGYIQ